MTRFGPAWVIVVLGALLAGVADTSALPSAGSEPRSPFQLAARKGTRNYSADSTAMPQATDSAAVSERQSAEKALADCMATWDVKTHISKAKWREICRRQLRESAPAATDR